MLDQLPAGFTASTQSDFLKQWGIEELVNEGNAYWGNMKHAPDVAAMKMRSRSSEAISLTDFFGHGAFEVCEYNSRKVVHF
jgi:hypothetical protein